MNRTITLALASSAALAGAALSAAPARAAQSAVNPNATTVLRLDSACGVATPEGYVSDAKYTQVTHPDGSGKFQCLSMNFQFYAPITNTVIAPVYCSGPNFYGTGTYTLTPSGSIVVTCINNGADK